MSSLNLSESNLTPLHQVFICRTHVLLQLYQSWNMFRAELTDEAPYKASIESMRLRPQELQESDFWAQKIKAKELQEGWKDIDGVLYHQDLLYVPKIVRL